MLQYIDKSAIAAEIKKRIRMYATVNACSKKSEERYRIKWHTLMSILSFIDTLEAKEVDFDFMLHEYWNLSPKITIDCLESATMTKDEMINFAKHFFELGISVNNPITAADRGTAEEIIVNLKRVEQDYHIDLTREIEWLRNKVKKEK